MRLPQLTSIFAVPLRRAVLRTRPPMPCQAFVYELHMRPAFHNSPVLSLIPIRTVHDTKKKDHTNLVTSNKVSMAFHKMSLNSLKNECRSRGLKVSGRKAELVSRITSHEGLQDSSLINPRKPNVAPKKRRVHTSRNSTDTSAIEQKAANLPLATNAHDGNALKYALPNTSTKLSQPNSVESHKNATTKATRGTDNAANFEGKLASRDKRFLWGFIIVTGTWWSSQYFDYETK